MLQVGKVVFVPGEEYIRVEKEFENSLYAKYEVGFVNEDDHMYGWAHVYFIKDRNKLKQFCEETGETVCWIEPDEEFSQKVGEYVLKFYKIYVGGMTGGDLVVKRITKADVEENSLFYLVSNSNEEYVIPCNSKDRFCFMFYCHYDCYYRNPDD